MRRLPSLIVLGLALAGCSRQPGTGSGNTATVPTAAAGNVVVPPDEAMSASPSSAAPADAAYLGRWTGVEGMYLVVAPRSGGGVSLEMQWDLDHHGTFAGTVTPAGVRFVRDGVARTLRPTGGEATGLKYLAGKRRCLTVATGEGYCRD